MSNCAWPCRYKFPPHTTHRQTPTAISATRSHGSGWFILGIGINISVVVLDLFEWWAPSPYWDKCFHPHLNSHHVLPHFARVLHYIDISDGNMGTLHLGESGLGCCAMGSSGECEAGAGWGQGCDVSTKITSNLLTHCPQRDYGFWSKPPLQCISYTDPIGVADKHSSFRVQDFIRKYTETYTQYNKIDKLYILYNTSV